MKITDIKTYVVGNPPPHFGGRYWTFLKLTTDSGIEGFGEVSDAEGLRGHQMAYFSLKSALNKPKPAKYRL